jgi:hypothetical protein
MTKINKKTKFPAFQKGFCTCAGMVFNILPTLSIDNFHAKIFVTLKSDPDPDTHWFGALDPDPHCDKKSRSGYGSAFKPMRIQNTA